MTRINIVPAECLTNKHLLAEYKEITRPFNKVINRIEKYGVKEALKDVNIPENYTLGKGHESFFFDKLSYLRKRYRAIYFELIHRGFVIDYKKYKEISDTFISRLSGTPYWNGYNPSPEEIYLNMARITKRSNIEKVIEEIYSE